MDARYWEGVGESYEKLIFDSALEDKHGAVLRALDEHADPRGTVCDLGCGVGHYLPLLAARFGRVLGVEPAASLIAQARARCAELPNVELVQADLSTSRRRVTGRGAGFAVCANVLISADQSTCSAILRALRRQLAQAGRALIVVPSLESALFANSRLVEWNERLGHSREDALGCGIALTRRSARELLDGLVRIDALPTRHYLREQLEVWLRSEGFEVLRIDKVEYDWATEFEKPPSWMRRGPGPWDWMAVAERSGKR